MNVSYASAVGNLISRTNILGSELVHVILGHLYSDFIVLVFMAHHCGI